MSSCDNTEYTICLSQYETFQTVIQLTDASGSAIDIGGWAFTGSIKEHVTQTSAVASFSCSVVDSGSATVMLTLHATQSALLTKRKYVYDVIAVDNSISPPHVYRIIEGPMHVDLGVTPY